MTSEAAPLSEPQAPPVEDGPSLFTSVYWIARLTILENLRRDVHLTTLFLAVGLLVLPAYVNAFSMGIGAFERISKDFGLTLIGYFGVGMAILLGSTALPADLEARTLYPVLARPLTRGAYLSGKFVGLALILAGSLGLLGVFLNLSISALTGNVDLRLFAVLFGYLLETWVLLAACLFFSTFASPAVGGVLGVFTYLLGGLSKAFVEFFLLEDRQGYLAAAMAMTFKTVLPHFDIFRIKNAVVHGLSLEPGYMAAMTQYGAAWVLLFLLLAERSFGRRDL